MYSSTPDLTGLVFFVYAIDEEMEREKLFHGATSDVKPRLRTAEEIRAQYRKTGVISDMQIIHLISSCIV